MAKVPNSVETLTKSSTGMSRAHERYRLRRQTGLLAGIKKRGQPENHKVDENESRETIASNELQKGGQFNN